jgi:hypothetical protein
VTARTLSVDPAASKLTIRTRAKGLLARLAHDLEIAGAVRGTAEVDEATWSGQLEIEVASLRVVGVVRAGSVDTTVLSASDRLDIERKIRDEVLAGTGRVEVRASGPSRERGEATIGLARSSARAPVTLAARAEGSGLAVSGRLELSLKGLNIKPIKGPLGAFEVSDAVEVRYELALKPA